MSRDPSDPSDRPTVEPGVPEPVVDVGSVPIDPRWGSEPRFCLIEVILDNNGEPYDYRFLESSPAFDEHAGVPSVIGLSARELVPDLPLVWPQVFFDVVQTGNARQFFRPSEIDGRMIEVTAIPAGPPISRRVALMLLLATEAKRTEAELRRAYVMLEGIAEGTEDLIAAEDLNYRYTYFNEAYALEFERLWGRRPEVGSSMVELLADWPDEQRKAQSLWRRALRGESFRVETSFGRTPEESRTYDLRFAPLYDRAGNIHGAAHIFRDVTDRVEAERELREADRRKDEFLAMLGHELRNPLAAIQHASLLIQQLRHDDQQLARAAEVLERQSTHMTRLVEGLLEVSRVASGKISLVEQRLNLAEVVAEVIADRAAQIATSKVTVDRPAEDTELIVRGDRVRIAQILDNLLSNALKFTSAGGQVAIEIIREDQDAVIRVRDTGVGIAAGQLEQIFETFHQEEQELGRSKGGLGLGLALARGLAELHGGSLCAHSEGPDHGSEFELRLPMTSAAAVEEDAVVSLQTPSSYRLLLVEDNVDAAEMLSHLLHARGHTTVCVNSGREALEALAVETVDLVLCDIGLPDIDGYELARRIRAQVELRGLSLIALTGYGQVSDRLRSVEAGFDAHLTKPVALDRLEQVMNDLRSADDRRRN